MRRILCFVTLVVSILSIQAGLSLAASEQAKGLREKNGLSEYAPPEAFLSGNFVADEIDPSWIFGKVKDFAGSRSCSASWLIDEGERKRVEAREQPSGPFECTLVLEEDCPGKVTYYVFVDRSQVDMAQWLEWRRQFHKNKAEPQYGTVRTALERAVQDGFPVNGELRFVEINGDLQLKRLEDFLVGELNFPPRYDIRQGKNLAP